MFSFLLHVLSLAFVIIESLALWLAWGLFFLFAIFDKSLVSYQELVMGLQSLKSLQNLVGSLIVLKISGFTHGIFPEPQIID